MVIPNDSSTLPSADAETTMDIVFAPFRIEVSVVGPRGPYGRRARRELAVQVFSHLKPLYRRLSYENIRHSDGSHVYSDRAISTYQACRVDHTVGHMGFQIRMARLKAGLTQKKFAEQIDVNRRHVSQVEKGRYRPNLKTRAKIEQVLSIQLRKSEDAQNTD